MFSGRVIAKNWKEDILAISIFVKGKMTQKGSIKKTTANKNQTARISSTQSGDCGEVCEYERYCDQYWYGDVLVSEECGEWQPTGNCWPIDNCSPNECDPNMSGEECQCQMYGVCDGCGTCPPPPSHDEEEFDEEAEAALKQQVYSTTTEAAETNVSYSSPDATDVPFQWEVVKNQFDMWKVISSDIAKGYNSTNTGAVLYEIQHKESSITGQTEWNRIRKKPGPTQPFIALNWQESSATKSIANNYKSGTITVSGGLYNAVWFVKSVSNKCTVTVQ